MASSVVPHGHDRQHNTSHPHHHIVNEGINALPGNDGVDQLEMEKEEHDAKGISKQYSPEIAEIMPSYSSIDKNSISNEEQQPRSKWSLFYAKNRIYFHILIGSFFTAWWLVGIIKHRDLGWIKPFLVSIQYTFHWMNTK